MASCPIKTNPRYQQLKRMSGVDEDLLDVVVMTSQDANGRYPELDEIPGADSSPVLIKSFGLEEGKTAFYGNISDIAPDGDIRKASAKINSTYRDLETKVTKFADRAVVSLTRRPGFEQVEGPFHVDTFSSNAKQKTVLGSIAEKLDKQYGFGVHVFNEEEAPFIPELENVDWQSKNAFVFNGEIWINTDNAHLDAPIHEMMHLLLGEIKYNDPELYNYLVGSLADTADYRMARKFMLADYAERDAQEEYFVTEASRYIAGYDTPLRRLEKARRSKLDYDIFRMTDTVFMGVNSAHQLGIEELGNMSIVELCQRLGSAIMNRRVSFGGDLGYSHRIAASQKRELIREGRLEENCV